MSLPSQPTETFPFAIEHVVGEGAMGVVYRAREPALGRTVAIKIIRPQTLAELPAEMADEIRARFQQEARAAAALNHPGATTIYAVGEVDDTPYIAMEWLEGEPLDDLLDRRERLTLRESVSLAVQLLETLDAAHRAGIVHRDIKPGNLVMRPDGRLKVTDFGIARVAGSELVKTQVGAVVGTPAFMAPEQYTGSPVDGRADLFAVAVVLYLALSGELPFDGETLVELATAVMMTDPVPITEHVPGLPAGLAAAIHKGLAVVPEERFATAREFASAIAPFRNADTSPVASPPPSRAADPRSTTSGRRGVPTISGLPTEPILAVLDILGSWPYRALGPQTTRDFTTRLLDRPLHAPAFSGGALMQSICVLVHEGVAVGAVHTRDATAGPGLYDRLPAQGETGIHALPGEVPPAAVPLLATLLSGAPTEHAPLDPASVDPVGLSRKLRDQRFWGLVRLDREGAVGWVFYHEGAPILAAFGGDWGDVLVSRDWTRWVGSARATMTLIEPCFEMGSLSFRHDLKGLELVVQRGGGEGPQVTPVADPRRPVEVTQMVARDPVLRVLRWLVGELPEVLRERGELGRWKYLGGWAEDVQTARLHHDLPRTGERSQVDTFDLVTADRGGRILHLVHRVGEGTRARFVAFLQSVLGAKQARLKSGDIGGAVLVAPNFDAETLDDYAKAIASDTGRSLFRLQRAVTKYAGFVRIGPRRGFHLMLVRELEDGRFEPVWPE